MNRREFLKDAVIAAAALSLGGCAPKETVLELKDQPLLKPEDISVLYPISIDFEPSSPLINHKVFDLALENFLPPLDENHTLVFRFTKIFAGSDSSISYFMSLYDYDTTTKPEDAKLLRDRIPSVNFTTNQQSLNQLLNEQVTQTFIQTLLLYNHYKTHSPISDQVFDDVNREALEFISSNGPIFTFSSVPSTLQQT